MSFWGDLLTVDLASGGCERQPFRPEVARDWLGGRGLNASILGDRLERHGPSQPGDTAMVWSPGLLTGVGVPFASRLHISGRSPLTGLLGSSNVGGHVGVALRTASVQSLILEGKAPRPSYLVISDTGVWLKEASDLWGRGTRETSRRIREKLGPRARVMSIGPAGEGGVRFACIMSDTGHSAGRTGMGRVMGEKNLKAVAVLMGRPAKLSGEDRDLVAEYASRVRESSRFETYSRYSNSAYVTWADELGILATRNFRQTSFEDAEKIDGKSLYRYVRHPRACYGCPVHCKAEVRYNYGRNKGLLGERPDIEPIANLGSKCGLGDPQALLYLYNLAGDLGLDAISAGGVLAFAFDLYDRGIITSSDTGGLALEWGDPQTMETLMRGMASQEGFGQVLGEGVLRAARLIGRGAEEHAYHAKGMELPAYDPRGARGTALGYAVSTRGADFSSVYTTPEFRLTPEEGTRAFGSPESVDRFYERGKETLVRKMMAISAVMDSLGICKVPILSILGDYGLSWEADLVSKLANLHLDSKDLFKRGLRILGAEWEFNRKHGAGSGDDHLPPFFAERPVEGGPTHGLTVDVREMVGDFYRLMGWGTDNCEDAPGEGSDPAR